MKRAALLLALLIALPAAAAFGISPASKDVTTQNTVEYALTIKNPQQERLELRLVPDGSIAPYLALGRERVTLEADEAETTVSVTVDVPSGAVPGTYDGGIIIEQVPETVREGGFVSAIPAVKHRASLTIPGNGKFVKSELLSSAASASGPVSLTVAVENVGTEDIEELSARIEVRSPTNELLSTLRTPERPLPVGAKESLSAEWEPPATGRYSVTAVVSYDGLTQRAERVLEVGDLDVRIGEPRWGEFRLGEVVRLDLPVTSEWNQRLPGVFASYVVRRDGVVVDRFTSLSSDLAPLGDALITAYWNTAGLSPGEYAVEATVFFGGAEKTETFRVSAGVDRVEAEGGLSALEWVELVLAALVSLVLVWWAAQRFLRNRG